MRRSDPGAWGKKNPELKKAFARAWRIKNREHVKETRKAWELKNPESTKSARRNWVSRNPEKIKASIKRHYDRHREEHIRMSIERHHQQLLFLDNLKTSCQICGENDVRCLDFHHRNPGEKSFSVVQSIRSMPRLLQEIEKCDILCANCHRKLHSKRRLWA